MTRTGAEWQSLERAGDPSLLFGWRPGPRRLSAARVSIHQTAFDALATIGDEALQRLSGLTAIPYGTYVEPDSDEYISLPRGTGPLSAAGGLNDDESLQVSALLGLLDDAAALDDVTGDQAAELDLIYYAVQTQTASGETVSFVKAVSPTATLRRGRFFLAGSDLRSVARPDVALAADIDLVVTADDVAILHRSAFDRLFADTDYAAADVESNLQQVVAAFPAELSLSASARDALATECLRLKSLAKRLHALSTDPVVAQLTPSRIRAALRRHDETVGDFINSRGELTFSANQVKSFLDLVEGRWWTSDFGEVRRRADRFRTR